MHHDRQFACLFRRKLDSFCQLHSWNTSCGLYMFTDPSLKQMACMLHPSGYDTMFRPIKLGLNAISLGDGLGNVNGHFIVHIFCLSSPTISWKIATLSLCRHAANRCPNDGCAQSTRLISDECAFISFCNFHSLLLRFHIRIYPSAEAETRRFP